MFKKIKESEALATFKELWNNPKTHSLIVLALWFIFIIAVIIFVRVSTTNDNQNNTLASKLTFENIKNYEFSYTDNTNELNGKVYNDKILFIMNNHRYYYNNDVYLINGLSATKQNIDLNLLKINTQMLNNLLSGLTGTTTNNYTQYVVPLDRFINLYEIDTEADLTKAMTYNIIVNVYKTKNIINKVVLDMTNYRIFRFNDNNPYIVTLYIYNINNISDFTNDYDKIIGGNS